MSRTEEYGVSWVEWSWWPDVLLSAAVWSPNGLGWKRSIQDLWGCPGYPTLLTQGGFCGWKTKILLETQMVQREATTSIPGNRKIWGFWDPHNAPKHLEVGCGTHVGSGAISRTCPQPGQRGSIEVLRLQPPPSAPWLQHTTGTHPVAHLEDAAFKTESLRKEGSPVGPLLMIYSCLYASTRQGSQPGWPWALTGPQIPQPCHSVP